jgi:hypothetical protein
MDTEVTQQTGSKDNSIVQSVLDQSNVSIAEHSFQLPLKNQHRSEQDKEKMDLENSQAREKLRAEENSQAVWNLDINLKAPLNRNFNVRINKRRKIVDLKNIIKFKLENMDLDKISNLKNLTFFVDGKKVALTSKFMNLWKIDQIPLIKTIEVQFEVKSAAKVEQSRIVTTGKIPRLTKYKCLPSQIEFFRM